MSAQGKVNRHKPNATPIITRYSRWWRLYAESLNDPKIVILTDRQFRAWVNINSIACMNEGLIPASMNVLSCHLRMTPADAQAVVDDLILAGLIDIIGRAGNEVKMAPHNWKQRQYKADNSAERMRRLRERRRGECDGSDVTCDDSDANRSDSVSVYYYSIQDKNSTSHTRGGYTSDDEGLS